MKALVIEGSNGSPQLLCDHLRRIGIKPVPAATGNAGIDLFLTERPDLVLLDIAARDVGAHDVARQIRLLDPPGERTPIIVLSDPNKNQEIERVIAAGGDDCLLKPISEAVFAAKIGAIQQFIVMHQSLLELARKLDSANQELKRLNSLDGLTCIPNRKHLDDVLAREWRRAMRQCEELSLIKCDIDFFRQYNEIHGHQNGDACLCQIVQALTSRMDRGGDMLARYGGEEFVAVLPGTRLSGAVHVASQMLNAVNQLALPHPGSPCGHVTVSFGVAAAVAMPETNPQDILDAAARALDKAKDGGRNRVVQTTSLDPHED